MDREGYPLPYAGNIQEAEEVAHMRRANTYMQHQNNEAFPQMNMWNPSEEDRDKESGEATTRRIMVLRRSNGHSSQQRNNKPVADLAIGNPPLSQVISKLRSDKQGQLSPSPYLMQVRKGNNRISPVVPHHDSGEQYLENQKVCISTWKEFVLGKGVLHPKVIKFNRQKNGCDTWYKLCAAYVEIISGLALYCLWMRRLLLLILRICLPAVGARLTFCHFILSHFNIHREEEEKCLNAKFCGAPFGGINLYAARTLYCPYCRVENQVKMTSKYFQSTIQERQKMAHKMAK